MWKYAEVHRGTQRYMEGYAEVRGGMQRYMEVCGGAWRYTEVGRCLWYTEVIIGNLKFKAYYELLDPL